MKIFKVLHIMKWKNLHEKKTIKNPNFFDIDEIFNEYVTNQNEKSDLYIVKCDFEMVFHETFHPNHKPELQYNPTIFFGKVFVTLDGIF